MRGCSRCGVRPGYQFTGPGEESITLSGIIMSTRRVRPAILDEPRALTAEGVSQRLASGTGEDFGRWIMDELTEERPGVLQHRPGAEDRVQDAAAA